MKALKYIAAVAVIGLASCQNDDLDLVGYNSDPDAVQITATVGHTLTRSNPTEEIGSEKATQFKVGDKISVSTEDQSAVIYVLEDDNSWKPVDPNAYLVWNKSEHTFTAHYPAGEYTGYEPTRIIQDSEEDIAKADYMSFSGEFSNTGSISFEMERRTARVVIDEAQFSWGNQYIEGTNAIYEVKEIKIHAGDAGGINPYKVGRKYYALVNPGAEKADAPFITLRVGPKQGYSGTEEELIIRGIPELAANTSYTFHLTIGKNKAELGKVTVEDWETDPSEWAGVATDGYTAYDTYNAGKAYDIYTLEGLLAVNKLMANGTKDDVFNAIITLHDDFVLPTPAPGESNWAPLGIYEEMPNGDIHDWYVTEFNGNGHTITGLVINNPDKDYQGFLGNCSKVSNLTLVGCTVKGNKKVGGIAGFCQEIENCTVKATEGYPVVIDGADGYVGGIVGHNMRSIKKSTLTNADNASVKITVSGQASRAGGIVGMSQGTITDCEVTNTGGEFIVKNYNGNQTGGLVGQNDNVISNCSVTGVTIDGFASVGGFIGSNGPLGRFTDDRPGNAAPTNTITGCTIIGYITNMTGLIYGDNSFIDWTLAITDGGGNTVNGTATK